MAGSGVDGVTGEPADGRTEHAPERQVGSLHERARAAGAFRLHARRRTGVFCTLAWPGGGRRELQDLLDQAAALGHVADDRAAADGGYALLELYDRPSPWPGAITAGDCVQTYNITTRRALHWWSGRLLWSPGYLDDDAVDDIDDAAAGDTASDEGQTR